MRRTFLPLVLLPWLVACAASAPGPRLALAGPPPALDAAEPLASAPTAHLASSPAPQSYPPMTPGPRKPGRPFWRPGTTILQGYLGATVLDTLETSGGSVPPIDGSDESSSQFPTIGGGAQWKLAGERVDFGFEGMLGFSGRLDGGAFVVGGGGATVAVNVDMLLFELYGGPFINVFLGERLRAYLAAGPVMQWASYDQKAANPAQSGSGSGFGTGVYARTGLELAVSPGTLVGLGVRWIDTRIDLDSGLGDLDTEGYQFLLTVTRGF